MTSLRLRVLLFALALAVQALAPVASGFAAAGNPRAGLSEICFKAVGDAGHDGRSAPGHSHQRDCPICQVFCDGVAPVGASASVVAVSGTQWATLQWREADTSAPAVSLRYAHRARAPPAA